MIIDDAETEQLAAEVAELTGESTTAAVRASLRERRDRLAALPDRDRRMADAQRFLRDEIWSQVPADELGKSITKAEREEILGYGPDGA